MMHDNTFRVLHAAETAKGGVGSYINDLASIQCKAYGKDSVRVVVPASHANHIENLHSDIIKTFPDHEGRLLNCLELIKKVKREALLYKPHFIHLHSTYAGFALRPTMYFVKGNAKIVYCPHAWAFNRNSSKAVTMLVKQVEHALSHLCDAIVCTSRCEYDSALRIGIDDRILSLILNGMSSTNEMSSDTIQWPDKKLKILFVGRFDRQKGIDLFLKAMAQLEDVAYAHVIGAPVVDREPLPDIPGNVSFDGWQPRAKLHSYYMSANALLMPSRWEGFGLTAAEAMRAGCAVLASRIGGISDVVEDKVTGILFEPDSVSAIVDAVRSVNPNMLLHMGDAGRSRFTRLFSSERMFEDMHSLYEKLIYA